MLAFYGHCVIVVVDVPALAFRTALEPVSGVDLYARLGGQDFEHASAGR